MDKIQDKSAEEVLKSKISVTNWNFLVTVLHSGEVYKQILSAMEEYKNQSSKDKTDKLISELQERAEIAEDELDKIKQSDKISNEEIEATAADIVFYNEEKRNWWIEGAKFIRDKLSVSEHSTDEDDAYEPYFGWCDVEGCENEGCRGGGVWPDTGYWTVCYKHSDAWRKGEPKPQMKQTAINREKSRKADRTLPPNTKLTSKT